MTLVGAFRRALDGVAPEGTLVVELPAPAAPLARFLAALPRGHAFLWQPPVGPALAGAGIARVLAARGRERFTAVRAAAEAVFAGLARRPLPGADAPAPRFVGGFAFVPGAADAEPWSELGDAQLTLPRWSYGGRWLAFAAPGALLAEAGARDAAAAELERLLDLLRRPAVPDDSAPVRARLACADDREAWRAHVTRITGEIAAGRLEKAVAARRIQIEADAPIDDLAVAGRLAAAAPGSTTFAFRRAGCAFLGATPERLVARRGRRVAAEALAGSISVGGSAALLRSDKDRREHALVVRAIAQALAPFCARVAHPPAPEIHTLRDVLHLRTAIAGELAAPAHVLELAEALHPTPAVGGVPTEVALRLLAAGEPARGWYAAPVGWFDAAGDGELCVALRCGLISGRRALAFAGAGIVAGSDPEREHDETALKLRALLGALGVGEA